MRDRSSPALRSFLGRGRLHEISEVRRPTVASGPAQWRALGPTELGQRERKPRKKEKEQSLLSSIHLHSPTVIRLEGKYQDHLFIAERLLHTPERPEDHRASLHVACSLAYASVVGDFSGWSFPAVFPSIPLRRHITQTHNTAQVFSTTSVCEEWYMSSTTYA